ncbi:MAG: NAD(P)-binding protein [Salinivirgaceae bacterium]|nr:NAD(P)-binding protein [Salinivirgaceae bacterium]
MKKVAIIGGGISGLSVAHLLKDRCQVVIYEKESQPGGLIRCRNVEGNLFHTCGGHVFNSKRQDVINWFWNVFEKENFINVERNSVVVFDDGLFIPYPIENHIYYFDYQVQMDIIRDWMTQKKTNEHIDNFEKFLKTQFGNTLYELYFKPYNEKIWKKDLTKVPLSWLDGKLPMPTVDEMIYNNINHVKEKKFVHSKFWYPKKGGGQYLADVLAKGLTILYNTDIKEVLLMDDNRWQVNGVDYDVVVFCGNIKDMVNIVKGVDISSYKEGIDKLDYHGTTSVFCKIENNPYSWIYQPSRKHHSHRIICSGNFSQFNNVGKKLTATVEFADEITQSEIIEELNEMPYNPTYLDVNYTKYSYPIQDNTTRCLIKEFKNKLRPYKFYFTGRFADWEYYNMDTAIAAAIDMINREAI